VACLIALGAPPVSAVAAVLVYRAIAVWLPAIPGVVSLARLRASVANWRVDTDNRTLASEPRYSSSAWPTRRVSARVAFIEGVHRQDATRLLRRTQSQMMCAWRVAWRVSRFCE
jgi:hypothetical protein